MNRVLQVAVRHFSKFALISALLLGIAIGMMNNRSASAQMEPQNYFIQAGTYGPGNIEVLAFAPQNLQIHRGDTVTWVNNGFHNVRFDSGPTDLVIVEEVNGEPVPQINPRVAFPTIENGSTYQGGEAGIGLPIDPAAGPLFSLVMDVEPGAYSYVCDVHPGMLGSITVVADDVAIPSPIEAASIGGAEFGAAVGGALPAVSEMSSDMSSTVEDGVFTITAGNGGMGRVTINEYFPFNAVITVGESVTWTIREDGIEPHTVSWPPVFGQDVAPIPQEGGPPILALGPTLAPLTESGASVGQGDAFSSGLFFPGQSFTLTFTEPGAYPFVCNIHPGMSGTVTVLPAQ